jgi:predicted MPP superfamily phosphohydrolase
MPWVLRITLAFLPLLLIAYGYSGWKLYYALGKIFTWPKDQIKWILLAAIAYLNLHPFMLLGIHQLGFESFSKSIREGQKLWDILFTYPFWIGLIIIVEILPWLLVADFVKLPFYPFYKRYKTTWLLMESRVVVVLMIVLTLFILFRIIIDTNRIRITEVELFVPDLPKTLNGLKIVHISDIQADPRTKRRKIRRYVKRVNKLKPDVVFFTGDLVTSGTKYIDLGAEILGTIDTRYGIYASLGDHDLWSDTERIVNSLKANEIVILENKNYYIQVENDSLLVTFITNAYSRRPRPDQLYALMGAQPRGVLDVVITHQPSESIIELAAERGYHLFLAGHTHGGQIVFRPFGFSITPTRFESPYYKGCYLVDNMLVSINSGLGFTFAPFRYNAPGEITVIKLVGQEA